MIVHEPEILQENGAPGAETPSPPVQETQKRRSQLYRAVRDVVETLLLAALMFALINFLTARIRVEGTSMEPSLHSGGYILVNRLAYWLGEPAVGDVIVFHYPRDPEQEYIKRVIGLPGDNVVISAGQVQVNGQVLEEPYIMEPPDYEIAWKVPAEHLFVLGDNRNSSSDSHQWGPVPQKNVVGQALLVYWPLKDIAWISHAAAAQR